MFMAGDWGGLSECKAVAFHDICCIFWSTHNHPPGGNQNRFIFVRDALFFSKWHVVGSCNILGNTCLSKHLSSQMALSARMASQTMMLLALMAFQLGRGYLGAGEGGSLINLARDIPETRVKRLSTKTAIAEGDLCCMRCSGQGGRDGKVVLAHDPSHRGAEQLPGVGPRRIDSKRVPQGMHSHP